MELKLDKSTLVAVGVIVLALWLKGSDSKLSLPNWVHIPNVVTPVGPDVVIPEPAADAKSIVQKHDITRLVKSGKNPSVNAPQLGYFYTQLGKITIANENVIKTTAQVRDANAKCGQALFNSVISKSDYPGLAEAIDASVMEAIDKKNAPLTPETRAKAVKIFEAIGWACYQGGK